MPSFRYTAVTTLGRDSPKACWTPPPNPRSSSNSDARAACTLQAEPADQSRGFLADLLGAEFAQGRGLNGAGRRRTSRASSPSCSVPARTWTARCVSSSIRRPSRAPARSSRNCATRCATAARSPPHSRNTRAAFPSLYVGLVRAGEAGGMLAATLARLAELLERQRALRATVITALIYPVDPAGGRPRRHRACC